jgi:hypothetical protein
MTQRMIKNFHFHDGHIWKHESDMAGVIYNTLLSVLVHFARMKREKPDTEEAPKA